MNIGKNGMHAPGVATTRNPTNDNINEREKGKSPRERKEKLRKRKKMYGERAKKCMCG